MNIDKPIHFLRRVKQLNWHRDQPLSHDSGQHDHHKIIEYQDRWTKSPSRDLFWLNGRRKSQTENNNNACWPW